MSQPPIARVYVTHNGPDRVAVRLPETNYELHLEPASPVTPTPQGRATGVIRCRVWKVDFVSSGGAYIEPLIGRPRRVQGRAIGAIAGTNSLIVEVRSTPIVADLPPRWSAAEIEPGTRVGLDIYPGAVFEPAQQTAAV